jgi:hypothetical protein
VNLAASAVAFLIWLVTPTNWKLNQAIAPVASAMTIVAAIIRPELMLSPSVWSLLVSLPRLGTGELVRLNGVGSGCPGCWPKLAGSFCFSMCLGFGTGLGRLLQLAPLRSNTDAIRIKANQVLEGFMGRKRIERSGFRFRHDTTVPAHGVRAENPAYRTTSPSPSPLQETSSVTHSKRSEQKQNRESRAKNARCIRTLTFILSLAGRGDKTSTSLHKALLAGREGRKDPALVVSRTRRRRNQEFGPSPAGSRRPRVCDTSLTGRG